MKSTYRERSEIPIEIYENKILANYFGGWSVLSLNQFKSESQESQLDILTLLAKYKEIEAYTFFKPESKFNEIS